MNVLLSGPNLDSKQKVAGIGTVAKLILGNNTAKYKYFVVGRDDNEKRNFFWIVKHFIKRNEFKSVLKMEFNLIHLNTSLYLPAIIREFSLISILSKRKEKILLHLHGGKFLLEKPKNFLISQIIKNNYKKVYRIIVLSELEKEKFPYKQFKNKIEVLRNSIDFSKINIDNKYQKKTCNSIVFFGRINYLKGIDELFQALGKLQEENLNFTFELYGEGPQREEYCDKFKKKLGNKFVYGGVISEGDKWTKLNNCEFFVLPSRMGEGLPMALLESMAVGCIPIVTNDASIATVVKSQNNGFIVEKNNYLDLYITLKKVLMLDDIKRKKISDNAINTIKLNYSSEYFYNQLNKIYSSTV